MFKTWRIFVSTINMENGENDTVTRKSTEKEARDFYLNQLSSLGTNPQTKGLIIRLYEPSGDLVDSYSVDNSKYI